jgi:hypothetical protein
MKYSFSELGQNIMTRKFGGTTMGVADPYITGIHYIWFDKLPAQLATYASDNRAGGLGDSDIKNILAATCLSVTPPGGTLNKVEFTGLGGIKWAVPGNVDYGNSVSVKFFEFQGLPLLSIFHGWIKMIRDYRTGVSDLIDGDSGEGYTKKTYAGLMYYWTTAPDGQTIEYSACYDGVFPNKDPQDLFSSDVENTGKLDVEIEFNVDTSWTEPWVLSKCQSFMSSINASRQVVKDYGQNQ